MLRYGTVTATVYALTSRTEQDGAEPSAVSVTLYNLNRLAHLTEDRHTEYQEKAKSILNSNSQLLENAPFALATMVSAALIAQRGYKQVRSTDRPTKPRTLRR